MEFPEVHIDSDDSVASAADKVARACRALGEDLYGLEPLNSLLPTADYCHFFQTRLGGEISFVVVMIEEWTDATLVPIIDVLLEIRLDSAFAQGRPLIRFCSLHPVPAVLHTLFDRSSLSDFECRAAPVVRFGSELDMESSLHIAAVGMCLLRETLNLSTDFWDPNGEDRLSAALKGELDAANFPDDGVPVNTLVSLGFFFGERQRAQLDYPSRWEHGTTRDPWPCILFDTSPEFEPVRFRAISLFLAAYERRAPETLPEAVKDLAGRCAARAKPR